VGDGLREEESSGVKGSVLVIDINEEVWRGEKERLSSGKELIKVREEVRTLPSGVEQEEREEGESVDDGRDHGVRDSWRK
jgi:hypothetical protein